MGAEPLDGHQVADLLWSRLAPTQARTLPALAPSRQALRQLAAAGGPAGRLRDAIAHGAIDLTPPARHVGAAGDLEQPLYVSGRPQRTFHGSLLHAVQADRPWTLSVHITMRDHGAMLGAYRRRARVLWGSTPAPRARASAPTAPSTNKRTEVVRLTDELAAGGESIADIAIYQSLREPGPAPDPSGRPRTTSS